MASKRFEGRVREGMVVVTADGESLGKVRRVWGETFETDRGSPFRQQLTVGCDEVLDVHEDDVFLIATTEELMARCGQDVAPAAGDVAPCGGASEEPLRKAG